MEEFFVDVSLILANTAGNKAAIIQMTALFYTFYFFIFPCVLWKN